MKNGRTDRTAIAVMVIIIGAVLALAIYAVYGVMGEKIETKNISEGKTDPTVRYMAKQSGMSVEDYLAQYGLENAGINQSDTTEAMMNAMTVENYAKFSQAESTDALLEQYGLKGQAEATDNWGEVQNKIKFSDYVKNNYGMDVATVKEMLSLGDNFTDDALWGDVKDEFQEKLDAYIEEMENATPAPTAEIEASPAAETATEAAAATAVPAE